MNPLWKQILFMQPQIKSSMETPSNIKKDLNTQYKKEEIEDIQIGGYNLH